MDQELDLRVYVTALLKHKYWIVGLAVGAAVVAMAVSFLLPPTYEATALVAVAKPSYEMRFDSRFAPISGNLQPPYKAYPLLAMGDDTLSALAADLGDQLPDETRSVHALRSKLEATSSGDPSLIRLTAQDGDPQRAAAIANQWAARFVQAANELYAQSTDELAFFEGQQAEAETTLAEAEAALIDFQARNQASILKAQLDHLKTTLSEHLAAIRLTDGIVQDAHTLRERLSRQNAGADALPSDEITSLLLEIQALNRSQELPIQLQVSVQQDLGERTAGDQVAFLDSLIEVLEQRLVLIEQKAQEIEPDLLGLQRAHQEVQTELERLETAQTLSLDTYMSLSRKVTEARIAAQDTTGDVRVASKAAPPENPSSPQKLLNAMVAGVLGLAIGVVGALAIEFWRQGPKDQPSVG
jgi:uncharacterized protein involved in exopolysaccharide biosynthesis